MPLPKSLLCVSCRKNYPEGWKRCPYCGYDEVSSRQRAAESARFAKLALQRGIVSPGAAGEVKAAKPGKSSRPQQRSQNQRPQSPRSQNQGPQTQRPKSQPGSQPQGPGGRRQRPPRRRDGNADPARPLDTQRPFPPPAPVAGATPGTATRNGQDASPSPAPGRNRRRRRRGRGGQEGAATGNAPVTRGDAVPASTEPRAAAPGDAGGPQKSDAPKAGRPRRRRRRPPQKSEE